MQLSSKVRFLAISGSLREKSYNTALLRASAELAPEGVSVDFADISQIPFYNDDLRLRSIPDPVDDLQARIRRSDAVIFSTPEYNRSIPGVLKNAIDWASRPANEQPFSGKPVTIMGVSTGMICAALGTYHLRQIMVCLNAFVLPGPEVMIGQAAQKFDATPRLVDGAAREFIAQNLARLAKLARQLRAP